MLRRNVIKQLREVGNAAEGLKEINFVSAAGVPRIEVDVDFSKCLIRAALAYATTLVDGRLARQEPKDALAAIIATAGADYVGKR